MYRLRFGMSATLERVKRLAAVGDIRISEHGYDELAADGLSAREIVSGLDAGIAVEDYPAFHKGPCVLVLQLDANHAPVHALWGLPIGSDRPAVLITAYRPDPKRWDESYMVRMK